MTIAPVRVERRVGQRFPFLLPVSFRVPATGVEGLGFTQDLSSRGAFFLTDASLHEGDEIELTITMPSEITLGKSMRVRCSGRILRAVDPADKALPRVSDETMARLSPCDAQNAAETKIAVAVRFEGYDYLADTLENSPRVAVLHPHRKDDAVDLIPPRP